VQLRRYALECDHFAPLLLAKSALSVCQFWGRSTSLLEMYLRVGVLLMLQMDDLAAKTAN
jgi:hypothetical protein